MSNRILLLFAALILLAAAHNQVTPTQQETTVSKNRHGSDLKSEFDQEFEQLGNRCNCHRHHEQRAAAPICLRSTVSDSERYDNIFDCQGIVDVSSCQQAFAQMYVDHEQTKKKNKKGKLGISVARPKSDAMSKDKLVFIQHYQDLNNLLCYNASYLIHSIQAQNNNEVVTILAHDFEMYFFEREHPIEKHVELNCWYVFKRRNGSVRLPRDILCCNQIPDNMCTTNKCFASGAMNFLPPDYEQNRHHFSNEPMDGVVTMSQTRIENLNPSDGSKNETGFQNVTKDAALICPVDKKKHWNPDPEQSQHGKKNDQDDGMIMQAVISVWVFLREYKGYFITAGIALLSAFAIFLRRMCKCKKSADGKFQKSVDAISTGSITSRGGTGAVVGIIAVTPQQTNLHPLYNHVDAPREFETGNTARFTGPPLDYYHDETDV